MQDYGEDVPVLELTHTLIHDDREEDNVFFGNHFDQQRLLREAGSSSDFQDFGGTPKSLRNGPSVQKITDTSPYFR